METTRTPERVHEYTGMGIPQPVLRTFDILWRAVLDESARRAVPYAAFASMVDDIATSVTSDEDVERWAGWWRAYANRRIWEGVRR